MNEYMNVGVVGSRGITTRWKVQRVLENSTWLHLDEGGHHNTIISGGADGVDSLAELIAEDYGIPIEVIEPNYDDWSGEHPAKARNTEIVKESDVIIAVWDGQSNGTRDTIDKALDRGVPIYVDVVE